MTFHLLAARRVPKLQPSRLAEKNLFAATNRLFVNNPGME
jgi:hypothetical protein